MCSARFQIFLAEPTSRRSSRKHRAEMTFLVLLPILQLVEGVSSQMFREEGPSLRGCPANEEQKYCTVCQTVSASLDWVPGIMCPRPAHAPTPTPTPDGGQPAWLFLACPITSGPRDSNQAVQMAVAGCRRRGPPGLLGETWLGVAMSHWDEYFLAGWAGSLSLRRCAGRGAGRTRAGWGWAHKGTSPVGWVGIPAVTSFKFLSWADKLCLPVKAPLEDIAEWGLDECVAVGR